MTISSKRRSEEKKAKEREDPKDSHKVKNKVRTKAKRSKNQSRIIQIRREIKTRSKLILFAGLISLFVGCSNNDVFFEEYIEIPNQTWANTNIPYFEFEIPDTIQRYNMYFNIRHTSAFEYQNLWVFRTMEVPGGQMHRDTLQFILQDDQDRWLGTSSGDIRDGSILINTKFRFPYIGKYKMSFEQAMRVDELEDVSDIGLKIEKAK